jgi:hypothetical protein
MVQIDIGKGSHVSKQGAAGRPNRPPTMKEKNKKMARQRTAVERSFDVWLDRELHRMFDAITQEPLPDDLVRLIERSRTGKTGSGSK